MSDMFRGENKILLSARKKLGLTQQQVSKKARITIRHYQMFESGERRLSTSSFNTAGKVLEALELDLTAFARGEYDPTKLAEETAQEDKD
jgi:transcriptional regulator with XRE-family HTH domain